MLKKVYEDETNAAKKTEFSFFVLVADIGGSNTYISVLGLKRKKGFHMFSKYTCETAHITQVSQLLNEVLKESKERYDIEINRCCIGAAGPVSRRRGYIKLTNVNLEIRAETIKAETMLNKVILVNDFEAIAYGLDSLDKEKDLTLLPHVGDDLTGGWTKENVYAVVGAGSGLGVSLAYYDQHKHLHTPLPSEGGHMDFPIHDEFDLSLAVYLKKTALTKKDVFPEFERVLSGHGMETLFDFLCSQKGVKPSDIIKKIAMLSGNEKLHAIEVNYAKDPICKQTMDKLIEYYARAARMLAMVTECYGGLFLTGRIVENNIPLFKRLFMKEFEKHDKRNDLLRKIPVYILRNEDVGILGCANVAANFYNLV